LYPTIDVSVGLEDIDVLLAEGQHYCNWEWPHNLLQGLTLKDWIIQLSDQTSLAVEISSHYQIKKEGFLEHNYKLDLHLRKLKPSL